MSSSPPSLPDGLVARPLTVADVPAVTDLLARWEAVEPSGQAYDQQDVREEFTGPSAHLAGSLAVCDGDGVVGYGLLHVISREPEWVAVCDGAVDPRWWRRGIGRWIVDRHLEQAADLRAGRPAELRAAVSEGRDGARELFTGAGFTTRRWFERMSTDLAVLAPPPAIPADVHIRPWAAADDEPVRRVSNLAFADHFGSKPRDPAAWRAEVTGAHSFRPQASFVAEIDGEIMGFALAAEFTADSAQRGRRTGYVSRVGTVRQARGRGIGGALVARVLTALRDDGYAAAELDVDSVSPTGAGRVYTRLGFVPVHRVRMLIRSLDAGRNTAPAGPVPPA